MKRMKYRVVLVSFLICMIFMPVFASAQLLSDPKGDILAPPGTDLLLVYGRHVTGSDFYKFGNYISNTPYTLDVFWLRYAHYGQVGPVSYLANVIVTGGTKSVGSGATEQTSSGIGDTTGAFAVWFLKTKMLTGAFNYTVTAPTGEYRAEKSTNMGSNMWYNQPEVFFAFFPVKRLTLEANAAIGFYSKNTDYQAAHNSLEKDPIALLTGHVTYDITSSMFISASYYWNRGGEQKINGVTQIGTDVATQGVMATYGLWITKQFQILAQYQQDIDVRYGQKTNGLRLRLAYLF